MSRIEYSTFQRRYREYGVIGSGSFGKLVKIKDLDSGRSFALKKLNLDSMPLKNYAIAYIYIQKQCKHPLIIYIFEYYEVKISNRFTKDGYEIGMIMELGLCSLYQMICARRVHYSVDMVLRFALEFIELFAWLEQNRIVHRDIKPGNIIVVGEELKCKLADFGLCCRADQRPKQVAGSFHYASPKMKKNFKKMYATLKTNPYKDDVYSFGLTMYELITKNMYAKEIREPYEDIKKESQSELLACLVELMLEHYEERRPTFVELLELPNIAEYREYRRIEERYYERTRRGREEDYENLSKIGLIRYSGEIEYNSRLQLRRYKSIEFASVRKPTYHIYEKRTYKKQDQYQFYRFQLRDSSIQSLITIDDYLLCGCDDGNIKVVNLANRDRYMTLYKVHHKYVSLMRYDIEDNLWSTDGYSRVLVWNRKALRKCIINNQYSMSTYVKNIFGVAESESNMMIRIGYGIYQYLSTPAHKGGISALECYTPNKYAVGYYTGDVYLLVDGESCHCKMHDGPVTAVKFQGDTLYTAGVDGVMKSIDIKKMKMRSKMYVVGYPICGVYTSCGGNLYIITVTGSNYIIKEDYSSIFESKFVVKNILAYLLTSKAYFVLAEDGVLAEGKNVVCQAYSKGWNCMTRVSEYELALGSFEGEVIVVSWKYG